MKKRIFFTFLVLANLISAFEIENIDFYCIGIGKAYETREGIKFSAKLCRIKNKILKNITVYHNNYFILDDYDATQKLIYTTLNATVNYNENKKTLDVTFPWRIGSTIADSGSIFPISEINESDVDIRKEDLKEVYSTLH